MFTNYDTTVFKRLKNLKQLGIVIQFFRVPYRFEHSGVCYLVKMIRSIAKNQPELKITKRDIELIEIVDQS